MIRRVEWIVIGFIVVAYLVIAGQYAARTPDWQAPDEPAHYNVVRQMVDEGKLPVLEMGDWQQEYQEALVASNFEPDASAYDYVRRVVGEDQLPEEAPDGWQQEYRDVLLAGGFEPGDPRLMARLETVEYEDHQPPLYYALQAPVYALTDGDLRAMRWLSVLMGAGVVLCTWALLRTLIPRWPGMALTGAGFVAFIPQHLSILASVSNDALAELVVAVTLLATVIYLGNSRILPHAPSARVRYMPPVVLGVLVGVALLTKTTIYFLGGIVVLAVLLRWRRERWTRQHGLSQLAAVLIPALLMGGVWWVRNLDVYGGTDFTALARHDAITVGQPRTDEYIETVYGGSTRVYLENYAKTTFRSFWGQFGWMALPMPRWVYTLFLLFTLVVMSGAVLFFWQQDWPRALTGPQRDAQIVLGAVMILVFAAYILYNIDFIQFQGRYLYPALIPLAAVVAVGLGGWACLVDDHFPALIWFPLTATIGLALFALYALETYIVPNLPVW